MHDIIEDTDTTLHDLKLEFPNDIVEAVALLTNDEAVDYFDYIKGLKNNPIARRVKLADLEHNSDENKAVGSSLSENEQIYWKEKYAKAKMILLN